MYVYVSYWVSIHDNSHSNVAFSLTRRRHAWDRDSTARQCSTLRHTAIHCYALLHTRAFGWVSRRIYACESTATHCNTLQHTATHCNTLQHTAEHCSTLQHTATHCNTQTERLPKNCRNYDKLQLTRAQQYVAQCIYACDSTHTCHFYRHLCMAPLQHTEAHCHTLQHIRAQ